MFPTTFPKPAQCGGADSVVVAPWFRGSGTLVRGSGTLFRGSGGPLGQHSRLASKKDTLNHPTFPDTVNVAGCLAWWWRVVGW